MPSFLKSHGFAAAFGAVLYLAVTAALWPRIEPPAGLATATIHKPPKRIHGPSWDYSNPELDQLVEELRNEKAALAERKAQLEEFAARLQAEQMEINVVTQRVHQLKLELDALIVHVSEQESANLKKLARVYAAMSPEGAASIVRQLDVTTVVKVLTFMKDVETAPLLEALTALGDADARLAADLCERLRLTVSAQPTAKTRS